MENQQPVVRLNFTCDRNWADMQPVEGGRFCNDCQKKVIDFTDKTNDEIAAYLMSSTTQICGRFQKSQLATSMPKPVWKRWLSAVAMLAVFMGIKEASAQTKDLADSTNKVYQKNNTNISLGGEIVIVSNNFTRKNAVSPSKEVTSFGQAELSPQFPGGTKALNAYLLKNLHVPNNLKGRIITYFVIEKDGSLTDIRIIKGLNKEADTEAIRVLNNMPKWTPAIQAGKPSRVAYTVPLNFGEANLVKD